MGGGLLSDAFRPSVFNGPGQPRRLRKTVVKSERETTWLAPGKGPAGRRLRNSIGKIHRWEKTRCCPQRKERKKTLSCFQTAPHKVEGMFSQVPEMLGPVGVAAGLLYAFPFYPSDTRGVSPAPAPVQSPGPSWFPSRLQSGYLDTSDI